MSEKIKKNVYIILLVVFVVGVFGFVIVIVLFLMYKKRNWSGKNIKKFKLIFFKFLGIFLINLLWYFYRWF